MMLTGRALHAGKQTGEVIKLDAPISFWGGFDPATGTIIDRAHPQVGGLLAGRIVAMPGSRGSSGTPGVLGEALRRGTGPAGFVVTKADINLTAGAMIAQALYRVNCPIVLVDDLAALHDGDEIELHVDGSIVISRQPPIDDAD